MNGQSRAIPAEYVKAVFEVKSRFNAQNVKNAINHIGELEILLSGQNPDPDGYNLFLPKDFFWSLVFFDFKIGDRGKLSSLNNFLDGLKFRGIAPSVILRYEGFENEMLTGSVELFLNEQKEEAIADVSSSQFEFNDLNASFVLRFTEENFSRFAFSTLRLLNPNLGYSNYVSGSSNSEFV